MLCKTSNPGAGRACRTLRTGAAASALYRDAWRGWRQALEQPAATSGLVVGATDPEALARVRAAAPDLWFLVPGVGAQGGDLEAALGAGLRADGLGLLINVSRSIARAADPGAEARRAARRDRHRRHTSRGRRGGCGHARTAGRPRQPRWT